MLLQNSRVPVSSPIDHVPVEVVLRGRPVEGRVRGPVQGIDRQHGLARTAQGARGTGEKGDSLLAKVREGLDEAGVWDDIKNGKWEAYTKMVDVAREAEAELFPRPQFRDRYGDVVRESANRKYGARREHLATHEPRHHVSLADKGRSAAD